MSDYVRQMPEASADLASAPRISERFHVDLPLLVLLLALTAFGLLVLYSASGQQLGVVVRQARFFVLAYVVMLVSAQISMRRYQRWTPSAYAVGIALLVAVIFAGTGAKGAQRWLTLGGFRFQPSEVMKLMVPLAVAWYLSSRVLPPRIQYVVVSLLLLGVPAALVLRQPDLGTALLIALSGLFVLFTSARSLFNSTCRPRMSISTFSKST